MEVRDKVVHSQDREHRSFTSASIVNQLNRTAPDIPRHPASRLAGFHPQPFLSSHLATSGFSLIYYILVLCII